MRKQILTSLLCLSILACQENIVDRKNQVFTKATGDEITQSDAERWINRYSNLQATARLQGSGAAYNIDANQLDAMLETDDLEGIAFHHGTDEQGEHHVIAIPLDKTLALWNPGKYIVDANTNERISMEVGKKWASNYKEQNAGGIWYHRFGSDIFSEIKSIPSFQKFDLQPAINDENIPQLVLVVGNDSQGSTGRVKFSDFSYFDKSNPCPCPGDKPEQ